MMSKSEQLNLGFKLFSDLLPVKQITIASAPNLHIVIVLVYIREQLQIYRSLDLLDLH